MKAQQRQVEPYQKLTVVRYLERFTLHEEPLHNIISADPDQVVANITIRKRDIPTPVIRVVDGYEQEQPSGYVPPASYIRFPKRSAIEEDLSKIEYNLEADDERWLRLHPKLRESGPLAGRLDGDTLEQMLDILEKMTGFGQMPPMASAEARFAAVLHQKKAEYHEIWSDVCAYWRQKRQRLGKPLLRRYWPLTGSNDTDPHKVFRPREKERYKLRKHRRNDLESYRRLQQLRKDFEGLLQLLDLVRRRELLKQAALPLYQEMFDQQIYELTDTSGKPRTLKVQPGDFKKYLISAKPPVLAAIAGGGGGASSGGGGVIAAAAAAAATASHHAAMMNAAVASLDNAEAARRKKKRRDRDGGSFMDEDYQDPYLPANAVAAPSAVGIGAGDVPASAMEPPSFLEALDTRESFKEAVLEQVEPNIPAYISNGGRSAQVVPAFKFRCRGRIARGGRVVFDRVPVRHGTEGEDGGNEADEEPPAPPRCVVVYSSNVTSPFAPPPPHLLQQPPLCLHVDDRKIRDIYAMDDENDESNVVLEPGGGAVDLPRPPGAVAIRFSVVV